MHACVYVCTCMHACMCICVYMYVCMCVYVCAATRTDAQSEALGQHYLLSKLQLCKELGTSEIAISA